jgi:hypothetical protein
MEKSFINWPQVPSGVPDISCNFYLVKNNKLVNNSTTTRATEKIGIDLESLEVYNILMYIWLNLKTFEF